MTPDIMVVCRTRQLKELSQIIAPIPENDTTTIMPYNADFVSGIFQQIQDYDLIKIIIANVKFIETYRTIPNINFINHIQQLTKIYNEIERKEKTLTISDIKMIMTYSSASTPLTRLIACMLLIQSNQPFQFDQNDQECVMNYNYLHIQNFIDQKAFLKQYAEEQLQKKQREAGLL